MASTNSCTIFIYYLLVVPLLVGSLFQQVYWCLQLPPTVVCDQLQGEAKSIKTVGEYSMGFKEPTHREEIGDPLGKHSINHDFFTQLTTFYKMWKRDMALVRGGKHCELNL